MTVMSSLLIFCDDSFLFDPIYQVCTLWAFCCGNLLFIVKTMHKYHFWVSTDMVILWYSISNMFFNVIYYYQVKEFHVSLGMVSVRDIESEFVLKITPLFSFEVPEFWKSVLLKIVCWSTIHDWVFAVAHILMWNISRIRKRVYLL